MDLRDINLLVGRNSTGKSRVLSVIKSIAKILAGTQLTPFVHASFNVELLLNGKSFVYEISYRDWQIEFEHLTVDGELRLSRDALGNGSIWYESEGKFINFKVDQNKVAVQNKNDQLQHPFIFELSAWAAEVALYPFGSDFGKSRLLSMPNDPADIPSLKREKGEDVENVVAVYYEGFTRFDAPFDQAIIQDMRRLGYNLEEVGTDYMNSHLPGINTPLLGLFTVESDLDGLRNPQIFMSQGMFRALALVIHMNYAHFSGEKRLLLVDDIGEGLDYERAKKMVDLLVDMATTHNLQVVMTSNDRFVMNNMPLEYWAVLERRQHVVKAFTEKTSPSEFEEFKFLGLSNFDFFKEVHFQ